jgi:purine-binding chemotaxis protein CheW
MSQTLSRSQRQVCAFTLGDHLFGIDVQYIQEVFRFQECTPVPLTPSLVTGLLNLRGQIVMAIDLRERLGLPERQNEESPTSIVVRIDNGILSFLVDELFDIMTLDVGQFEEIPETLSDTEKQFVTGCFKLENRLLIMLDTQQVADISSDLRENLADIRRRREHRDSATSPS